MKERRIHNEADLLYCQNLVKEYLSTGSVMDALHQNPEIAISESEYYFILKSWGIVTSPGRNTLLSETIYFFGELIKNKIPLEELYRNMPHKFRTSLSTLRRIYDNMKRMTFPRVATALLISPADDPHQVLIGKDVSIERLDVGKPQGVLTVPATFSDRKETVSRRLMRVFQQEVYSEKALDRNLPLTVIPDDPKLLMHVGIADVDVSVYIVPIDLGRFGDFSSFKLANMGFRSCRQILEEAQATENYRAGTQEVADAYLKLVSGGITCSEEIQPSLFNLNLSRLNI